MSTNGAPLQGAMDEEHPAWFTAYLQSLSIKKEEVRAAELDTVLQTCEDVSEVFRHNISAAYRTESKLEAACQTEVEALSQTLLQNPVSYSVPYPTNKTQVFDEISLMENWLIIHVINSRPLLVLYSLYIYFSQS